MMSPHAHGRPGEVVYFVGTAELPQWRVKIGRTRAPQLRIQQMSLWSPSPLVMLATVPGGCRLERQFHMLFQADRVHSEWFSWSPRMAAVIDEINGGCFDFAALPIPLTERPRKAAA